MRFRIALRRIRPVADWSLCPRISPTDIVDHDLPITDHLGMRAYGRGAGVGRARGVGITLGPGMYWMASTGGLALSRVSNRFAVAIVVSLPSTSQPKLLAGLSTHDCTSATICIELHVY